MSIPKDQIVAAFDKLNEKTDKLTYAINISDSKYWKNTSGPDTSDGSVMSTPNLEWEFLISIDPQYLKQAIQIICDRLNQEDAPRVNLQLMAKTQNILYPAQQQMRLFFYDSVSPDEVQAFLNDVARLFAEAGIQPDSAVDKRGIHYGALKDTYSALYIRYRQNIDFTVVDDNKYAQFNALGPITQGLHGKVYIQASYHTQCVQAGVGHCPLAQKELFAEQAQPHQALPVHGKKTIDSTLGGASLSTDAADSKTRSEAKPASLSGDVKQPSPLELLNAITGLEAKINEMEQYGKKLCAINASELNHEESIEYKKGTAIQLLAKDILTDVSTFKSDPTKSAFITLSTDVQNKLGAQDKMLKEHRAAWKPILANVLIALTGIGLLFQLGKVIHAATSKEGFNFNSGFFGARTQSEMQASNVESALDELNTSVNKTIK